MFALLILFICLLLFFFFGYLFVIIANQFNSISMNEFSFNLFLFFF